MDPGAVQAICNQPAIDQKTLANTIGYDTSTIAGVIDRPEAQGLVARNVSPHYRSARQITPTDKESRRWRPCEHAVAWHAGLPASRASEHESMDQYGVALRPKRL